MNFFDELVLDFRGKCKWDKSVTACDMLLYTAAEIFKFLIRK